MHRWTGGPVTPNSSTGDRTDNDRFRLMFVWVLLDHAIRVARWDMNCNSLMFNEHQVKVRLFVETGAIPTAHELT